MKKLTKETAIEMIVDNQIDYEHYLDTFYDEDDNFVIHVGLLKDNPKDVADDIYDDLYGDKKFLMILNNLDNIVKLIIFSPYNHKQIEYEMWLILIIFLDISDIVWYIIKCKEIKTYGNQESMEHFQEGNC